MTDIVMDNGGRRLGIERRKLSDTDCFPDRRSGIDRRCGVDRRTEFERRNIRQSRIDLPVEIAEVVEHLYVGAME